VDPTSSLSHPERAVRRRRAASAVARGMLPADAAEKYGLSKSSVWSACTEHNVKLPAWHRASVVEVVAALMQAKQGQTLVSIAKQTCVSKQRVHQILQQCRRYGIIGKEWPVEPTTQAKKDSLQWL
jgi:hypothetical protein